MAETEPSTSVFVPTTTTTNNHLLEDTNKVVFNSFSDPIQRTKFLMQYIQTRKQKAENEIAKKNILQKQKKDAKKAVENARELLRSYEKEVLKIEQHLSNLDQERKDLYVGYESVINKESERKRQHEAAVETRKNEEQLKFQQKYQSALVIASQILAPDHPVLLQLKNTQFIQSLFKNPNINIHLMQLILSLADHSNVITNNLNMTEASSLETYNSSVPIVSSQNIKTHQTIQNVSSQNIKTQQNISNITFQNVKTQQNIPSMSPQNIKQARHLNTLQQNQQLSNLANKTNLQQQIQQKFSNNVAFNLLRQNYNSFSCTQNQQFSSISNLPLQNPAFLMQYQQSFPSTSNNVENSAGLAILQQNLHKLLQSQFPVQTTTNNPITLQNLFANAGLSQETIYQTILANLTIVSKPN